MPVQLFICQEVSVRDVRSLYILRSIVQRMHGLYARLDTLPRVCTLRFVLQVPVVWYAGEGRSHGIPCGHRDGTKRHHRNLHRAVGGFVPWIHEGMHTA